MVRRDLEDYRRRRDFSRTAEPAPGKAHRRAAGPGGLFVVQKHAARRLHYDLRLELDGVLKSWAVPKGPSRDPGDKRLAVHTEDHPLSYKDFEGTIPRGEYGGGTVMVWDTGQWMPLGEGDPRAAYEAGRLKVAFDGERLKGAYHLVRMDGDAGKGRGGQDAWLLIKARDDVARPGDDDRLLREARTSVKSGRTLDTLADAASSEAEEADRVCGVRLSRPDKVLYADQGLTKRDVALFVAAVGDRLMRGLRDRPVSLLRCPDGVDGQCFVQRHPFKGLPEGVSVHDLGGTMGKGLTIERLDGLVGLVQLGVLEVHPWGARLDRPDRPDHLILDLDPDTNLPFARVREAALEARERLARAGLESFVKVTGGKGLHVVVPLWRRQDWASVKAFARALADGMVQDSPSRYVATMAKAERKGKVFIDVFRNDRGNTAVAAWSPRARPGAPVAVPVAWDDLPRLDRADGFTVDSLRRRLAEGMADPWQDMGRVNQSLTKAARRSVGLE